MGRGRGRGRDKGVELHSERSSGGYGGNGWHRVGCHAVVTASRRRRRWPPSPDVDISHFVIASLRSP